MEAVMEELGLPCAEWPVSSVALYSCRTWERFSVRLLHPYDE